MYSTEVYSLKSIEIDSLVRAARIHSKLQWIIHSCDSEWQYFHYRLCENTATFLSKKLGEKVIIIIINIMVQTWFPWLQLFRYAIIVTSTK